MSEIIAIFINKLYYEYLPCPDITHKTPHKELRITLTDSNGNAAFSKPIKDANGGGIEFSVGDLKVRIGAAEVAKKEAI